MNQYFIALLGFLSFGMLLAFLEILSRKFSLSAEWVRRIPHICATLFTLFLNFYLSSLLLLSLLGIFCLIMFLSRKLKILNHIHGVSRRTMGEELLPLGFIGAYVIANGNNAIFVPSLLLVGIADPVTGIVMERYRKHFLGILIFTFVSFSLLILFTQITWWMAIIISLLLAIVERISPYGTDNLSIPIAAALLLHFI